LGALLGLASLAIAGLSSFLFQITKRHGETLLELENRPAPVEAPAPQPPDQSTLLMQRGAPAGSVGMNFELPSLDGTRLTLTLLRGKRTLLVFIAPDCPQSAALLPELARLAPSDDLRIAFISTGDPEANRALAERAGITMPLLLQENREVADLYYAPETPMAYLIGPDNLTEIDRIDGAQAILGVALAACSSTAALPTATRRPLPPAPNEGDQPLQTGELLPPFSAFRPQLAPLTQRDLIGRRTLIFMFDPYCAPCLELLPDFARIHADPEQIDVLMLSRRDPAETDALAARFELPFPIAFQDNWEISRAFGARVFPAAFVVGESLRLETEIAVGRQAISTLHRQLRQDQASVAGRRLVSLAALLQRR
jgi:peroxiredoxin